VTKERATERLTWALSGDGVTGTSLPLTSTRSLYNAPAESFGPLSHTWSVALGHSFPVIFCDRAGSWWWWTHAHNHAVSVNDLATLHARLNFAARNARTGASAARLGGRHASSLARSHALVSVYACMLMLHMHLISIVFASAGATLTEPHYHHLCQKALS
jgi:hypothetical protein